MVHLLLFHIIVGVFAAVPQIISVFAHAHNIVHLLLFHRIVYALAQVSQC